MAPAKLTPAQIRDRKAKRVAVVLVVVLVAALAIQGPKILKMVHGSSPQADVSAVAVAVTPSSAAAVSLTPTTTTSGYVAHYSHFSVKDPFYAQNITTTTATTTAAPAAASQTTTTAKSAPPKTPATATQPSAAATTQATTTQATTTTALPFTVTTPAAPPNAAVLLANGKREVVPVGADFPSGTPLFKLNALGHKGKHGKPASSIRISVVGGSFADGLPTIPLLLGKPLTFANQSDGTQYVIKLVRLTTVATTQVAGGGSATTTAAPATTSPSSGG